MGLPQRQRPQLIQESNTGISAAFFGYARAITPADGRLMFDNDVIVAGGGPVGTIARYALRGLG